MSKNIFLIITLLIFSHLHGESPENKAEIEKNLSKCMACHGRHFENSAFNKAPILKSLSAASIESSLLGYKTGSLNKFGFGEMMKGQVKNIPDADLKLMATYIAEMK